MFLIHNAQRHRGGGGGGGGGGSPIQCDLLFATTLLLFDSDV